MIYLREISEKDIDVINNYRRDKKLVASLGAPFRYINIETDRNWFNSYQNNRSNNVRCAICLKNNDEFVGVIYLTNIDWISRTADFAISIGASRHRGKGIGREATLKILEHAFYDMNLNRVQLRVLDTNEPALKLYKSIGFKQEGLLREVVWKNNKYHNLFVMSILKKEFEG